MSARGYVITNRDELRQLRAAVTQGEIARSQLVLKAAAANRRAVNAENGITFLAQRVRVFLEVAEGPGREAAKRELLADIERCERGVIE